MALHPINRALSYGEPLLFMLVALYRFKGFFLVLFDIATLKVSPSELLSYDAISDRVFGKMWLRISEMETVVPALVGSASGTVLEIGPGSGNQLARYNKSNVTTIFGIEPNRHLHDELRANVAKFGLQDIYRIVPFGIEEVQRMKSFGVEEGSIDTVLSVQVLCGVPDPEQVCKRMYRLLRPGGTMIVYEHVEAKDWLSRKVQGVYQIAWPWLMGGCSLVRPTADYLLSAGKWETVDLTSSAKEDPWLVIPRVSGKLIKAKS
ncbi:uncharacterized protein KY384_008764 [Bacidia gigantensis]|uniref:uncharacterized protein n=1 Tax=Bacidia gigantensis TaxID=2732470 RepID=UPI001D0572CE|nr:uncharacterized protein KY384_008764 [Bacidia gigantensis]KAG8526563.1 hypothetical protein KY384_008764 [Bacidia gigantensis]